MENKNKKLPEENEYLDDEIKSFVEKEEKRRKAPSFIMLFLFTTLGVLFALGLSFSTIRFLENNETINSIISSTTDDEKYIITYSENTGNYSSGINLQNQFPIPDSQGKILSGKNQVFNFSLVLGDKTEGIYYEITAVPDTSNTLDSKYVKLYLEKNDKGVNNSYQNNGLVKKFSDYNKSSYEDALGVVIYSGKITKGKNRFYNAYVG